MRTAGLLALGAILNFTYADVVCRTEKLPAADGHSGSEVAKSLQDASNSASIEHLCIAGETEEFVAHQFGSTVFTITRTDESFSVSNCKGLFDDIVKQCIVGQNAKGGTTLADGLELEVHHGVSKVPSGARRALGARYTLGKRLPPKPAKGEPAPAKPAPAKPAPAKPAPVKPAPAKPAPAKPAPAKPAPAKPVQKKCPVKKPNTQKPSTQKPTKKTARDVLSSLVPGFFRRASPTPSELAEMEELATRCEDRPMAARAGWGNTFFGFYKESPMKPFFRNDIKRIVAEKYREVMRLTNDVTIVAGLYIPGDGIYLGTIAHGTGEQMFRQSAPASAPKLWSKMSNREPDVNEGELPGSLYHAEDVAMFNYESENARVPANSRYPPGTFIAVYGRKRGVNTAGPVAPCNGDNARIKPHCERVLNALQVDYR